MSSSITLHNNSQNNIQKINSFAYRLGPAKALLITKGNVISVEYINDCQDQQGQKTLLIFQHLIAIKKYKHSQDLEDQFLLYGLKVFGNTSFSKKYNCIVSSYEPAKLRDCYILDQNDVAKENAIIREKDSIIKVTKVAESSMDLQHTYSLVEFIISNKELATIIMEYSYEPKDISASEIDIIEEEERIP